MAIFINKAVIAGNLTADPEIQQTMAGVPIMRFSVAVKRKYTTDGAESCVDFHRCVAWRQNAEFLGKYARKGDTVCVLGEIQNRGWTDKQGQKRNTVEIIADEVQLFSSVRSEDSIADTKYSRHTSSFDNIQADEELPF